MTNAKSLKRALLSSVVALLLCCTMLVGTTYAWFTDSATSANNKITAGVLDVELWHHTAADAKANISDSKNPVLPAVLWEPNRTEVVYLSIKNNGNLALKYKVLIDAILGEGADDDLTDVMLYAITPNAKVTDAQKPAWDDTKGIAVELGTNVAKFNNTDEVVDMTLQPGEEHFFALSVHMLYSATNEYMGESISFDIRVLAGQLASEEDSFGSDYDKLAEYPGKGFAAPITGNQTAAEIQVVNDEGYKIGSVVVPAAAASGAPLAAEIQKSNHKANITVETGLTTEAFDVKVEGLADNNTVPVKTSLRIAAHLDPTTVKLYHYDTEIPCSYDWATGYVTFESATFSPFTVKFNPTPVEFPGATDAPESGSTPEFVVGKANVQLYSEEMKSLLSVTEYDLNKTPGYDANLEWGSFGEWSPNPSINENPKLEAAFLFDSLALDGTASAKALALYDEYQNWNCDFFLSLDRDLTEDQIFLGGYYDMFGAWVGFHNGGVTLKANEELALLGGVGFNDWTYKSIAENVNDFICGVGDVNNSLLGATFTVKLRLTNPENGKSFDVATVTYKFGSENPIAE